MLRVRTRTERISALAKCFSVALVLVLALCAEAQALSVKGVPVWLEGAVVRSLNAVWTEIPDSPEIDKFATLEVVASRLFAGYDVSVKSERHEPAVIFMAQDEALRPGVSVKLPELRGMSLAWFELDVYGLSDDVAALIEGVPQSALTWADEALREELGRMIGERLPGWEFSQQIYISPDSTLITLTFRPSSKMVLALKPAIYSRTIPAMFTSDLEAKLIPALSPLIGVPVEWAEKHKADIEDYAREFLEDRNAVDNLRAKVSLSFRADSVSGIEAKAESEEFMFSLWVAAYAGIKGRYPEAGAFFAFCPDVKLAPEIYAELIFSLDEFDITRRLGLRYETFSNFWAGIEVQWPDNKYFLRFQYDPLRLRRPYAWWRWSPELHEHEASIGYRIDEHVSIEVYYYSRGDDKVGIRGMWHL